MDKIKIIIVVLLIWCVGATGLALYALSAFSAVASECSALLVEISRKKEEIAQLKELVEAAEKRSGTRQVPDKTARDNDREALEQASQEKKTGRGDRAKPQM